MHFFVYKNKVLFFLSTLFFFVFNKYCYKQSLNFKRKQQTY